jgi:hypothetical protein
MPAPEMLNPVKGTPFFDRDSKLARAWQRTSGRRSAYGKGYGQTQRCRPEAASSSGKQVPALKN